MKPKSFTQQFLKEITDKDQHYVYNSSFTSFNIQICIHKIFPFKKNYALLKIYANTWSSFVKIKLDIQLIFVVDRNGWEDTTSNKECSLSMQV